MANESLDADWLLHAYAVNDWPVSWLRRVLGLHLASAMTLLTKLVSRRQMPVAVKRMPRINCCSYETLNSSVRGCFMSLSIAYTCAGMITSGGPIGCPARLTSVCV